MDKIDNVITSGIQTIDDLARLSTADVSPLIMQLYYYMDRINEASTNIQQRHRPMPNLIQIVKDHIIYHFNSKFEINSFKIRDNNFPYEIEEVDKIIILLPTLLSVVDNFKFAGKIECTMKAGELSFTGPIEFDQKIRKIREKVYSLTRKLLDQKCLLTFNLEETGNRYNLTINFNYSVNDDYRLIELLNGFGLNLVIDKVFDQFKQNAKQTEPHTVIKVSDSFSVDSFWGVPTDLDEASDLYYFSFLFRPVSLIIPKGGKIFSPVSKRHEICTGSGKSVTGWDIKTNKRTPTYYLDLFSVFNS